MCRHNGRGAAESQHEQHARARAHDGDQAASIVGVGEGREDGDDTIERHRHRHQDVAQLHDQHLRYHDLHRRDVLEIGLHDNQDLRHEDDAGVEVGDGEDDDEPARRHSLVTPVDQQH